MKDKKTKKATSVKKVTVKRTYTKKKSDNPYQDFLDVAIKNKVKTEYFLFKECLMRTSDGKPYTTPEQFIADGGDWYAFEAQLKNWDKLTVIE